MTPLADLTADEFDLVGRCLRAAVDGPFFPEWEFHTLFGMTRVEVRDIADRFPDPDEFDDEPGAHNDQWLAINNTLVNLFGYPHGHDAELPAPRERLQSIYEKWNGVTSSPGIK
jgi:hypothetical protein